VGIIDALDKAVNKIEEFQKKHDEKDFANREMLFEHEEGVELLVFVCMNARANWYQPNPVSSEDLVDKLNIYDKNKQLKYIVIGKRYSSMRQLDVYDVWNRHVGLLKEKMFTNSFSVEICGRKLGKIKCKVNSPDIIFKIDFNGWEVKENFFGNKISILKGNEDIATVFQKYGAYALYFHDMENELLLLMIVLALFSSSSESKDEIRADIKSEKTWFGF